MFRPSVTIPDVIRFMLPEDLTDKDVPRVPVVTRAGCTHLLFNPPALPLYQLELTIDGQYERHLVRGAANLCPMPSVGQMCWLVINGDKQRFFGRVVKVAEYQETRVILLVEHLRSPAIVSVAVPYEFYLGIDKTQTLWSRVMQWAFQQPGRLPDSNHPVPGM